MIKEKVCIMGGGSWATALAKIPMANGDRINWYMRRPDQIEQFKLLGHNPSYLNGIRFNLKKIKLLREQIKIVTASSRSAVRLAFWAVNSVILSPICFLSSRDELDR